MRLTEKQNHKCASCEESLHTAKGYHIIFDNKAMVCTGCKRGLEGFRYSEDLMNKGILLLNKMATFSLTDRSDLSKS